MLKLIHAKRDPAYFLASPHLSADASPEQSEAHDTMAEESYRDYLAARVLTENKPVSFVVLVVFELFLTTVQVTYRLLSRALKVDVNSAKRSVHRTISSHLV